MGAHLLSGALLDPVALKELLPDRWQEAPLGVPVTDDQVDLLQSDNRALQLPNWAVPPRMHNDGCHIISLGNLCRWLAREAEALGVEIYPGFAASELIVEANRIRGVVTGDLGLDKAGNPKADHVPGMALYGRYTLFAEGARGHLGKQLIALFTLENAAQPQHQPQHYAIGFKELWQVPAGQSHPGRVLHGSGWPLGEQRGSRVRGGFISIIWQRIRWRSASSSISTTRIPGSVRSTSSSASSTIPLIAETLQGASASGYGARAITKGGWHSLPACISPGGLLIGCDAGTLDFSRIKGIHTAMKSGMLAAGTVAMSLRGGDEGGPGSGRVSGRAATELAGAGAANRPQLRRCVAPLRSLAWRRLQLAGATAVRPRLSFYPAGQGAGLSPTAPASRCQPIDYPKPDGRLSFDKLSSVYLANTSHDEDQPCHLKLQDERIPVTVNLPTWARARPALLPGRGLRR